MAFTLIKDIKEEDNEIKIIAYAERVNILVAANGTNYLVMHLSDSSGRIEARKWSIDQGEIDKILSGNIYEISGKVVSFKNTLQLKVSACKILNDQDLEKQKLNRANFIVSAPIDIEKNFKWVMEVIDGFSNETYKIITKKILLDNKNKFTKFPAAINIHHNVAGGLFWHSVSLFKNIYEIKKNYSNYENIDWELAEVGAILHDIGKIHEMNDVIADDYTLIGKLIGHISIGSQMISEIAASLKIVNTDVIKMQHVILSSHGKREFGSPQEPNLIEGILISTFDNLDARLYHVNNELEKVSDQKWTQRIMTEDGRAYLRHFKSNKKTG